jgi:hypothetical protein
MGDGSLKEPYSYLKKGDRLQLRISHLEPEKRRVGFTQRWGTETLQAVPANASASEEGEAEEGASEDAALAEDAEPEALINNAEPAEGPAPGEETPSPSPEALAAEHVKDDAPAEGAPDVAEDDATTMMAVPPKSEES